MMMVDTINPNTEEPDNFAAPVTPPAEPVVQPQADQFMTSDPVPPISPNPATSDEHFFGGFDKPDDMKINLAGTPGATPDAGFGSSSTTNPVGTPQAAASEPTSFSDLAPVTPQPSPLESQVHSSYNKVSSSNNKLVMIVAAAGVAGILFISGISYFAMNSANNSKLKTQQEELAQLQSSLDSLKETPDSLQVAEETPTVTENTEVTTTTTPVPETTVPLETTTTTVPEKTDNSAQAAG